MRRFAVIVLTFAAVSFGLAACGGGGSKKLGPPAQITVSPSPVSLQVGTTQSLSVSVADASGNFISSPPTISFTSDNPSVVSVSTLGMLCGGIWDAAFTTCTPTTVAALAANAKANITVSSGSATTTVPVFAHFRIDSIVVTPTTPADTVANCVSQNGTDVFTAKAFNQGTDITSTVGPFTWGVSPSGVASATAATDGQSATITALLPGQANVFANAGGTASSALPASFFTVCPVKSIAVTPTGPLTATSTLTAATVDTKNATLANVPLQWNTSAPTTFSVTTGAQASTATAASPGTATLVASCTPPACNTNLYPVFSNAVIGTVAGTSATSAWVASTNSTSLFPIDATSNALGTAVTLAANPNSLVFFPNGTRMFLGASDRLMAVDVSGTTPTPGSVTTVNGKVLAVSPDSNLVAVAGCITACADPANPTHVYVFSNADSSNIRLNIPGAVHADFSPDGSKLYIATKTAEWSWSLHTTEVQIAATGANDVSFLSEGSFGFFAGEGGIANVVPRQTCDNSAKTPVATGTVPLLIRSFPNASNLITADAAALKLLAATSDGATAAGCTTSFLTGPIVADTKPTGLKPAQIIVAPDSSKVFIPADTAPPAAPNPTVFAYTVAGGTVTPITLTSAGAISATTGGITPDSKSVFVGSTGSNTVEKIDTATLGVTHIGGFPTGFTPDFVAVRPK